MRPTVKQIRPVGSGGVEAASCFYLWARFNVAEGCTVHMVTSFNRKGPAAVGESKGNYSSEADTVFRLWS
jgi:hypothetical protein